jgi:PAS domain S-box-containing protein
MSLEWYRTRRVDSGARPVHGEFMSGSLGPDAEVAAWLRVVVETSPIGMGVISTLENRYVLANDALSTLFGMPVARLLTADPYTLAQEITHPDEMVAEQKLFAELAVGARPFYRMEKRIRRPDGTTRWALATLSGILADEIDPSTQIRPLRFVVVQMVELTAQRALEESLRRREDELRHAQKVDGIGRLAAGIAHDFNNLLTVITGNAELLKDLTEGGAHVPAPSDVQEPLDAILEACGRAASLTAQVLAHGRRETVAPRTFVLSDAVGRLQQMLARTIGSDVQVHQGLNARGAVFGDEGQIGQVVMNLILNARDAIAERGNIRLTTRDLERDGEAWVALAVTDDGHGMSAETRARIFEPFFTTRTDRPGARGTGLGLATVARIVQDAGGRIDVESAPGRGTTVTVYLRRVERPTEPLAAARERRRDDQPPNTRRVLVVEDEPSVRSLIANVLLGAHYLVAVARDGEEALGRVESEPEPFDLVVADLVMPRMGGVALARRLRARDHHPPLLFISGYSPHGAGELEALGGLLLKPFTPTQLLEAVRETLAAQPSAARVEAAPGRQA